MQMRNFFPYICGKRIEWKQKKKHIKIKHINNNEYNIWTPHVWTFHPLFHLIQL